MLFLETMPPSLSFSSALPMDTASLDSELLRSLTFSGGMDERVHYQFINKKLLALETSLDIDQESVDHLLSQANQFLFAYEEKEEVLLRLDWLQRLYKAKTELSFVDTVVKLNQLRNLIVPVQTCLLKNQLLAEIDTLETIISKDGISEGPTEIELLFEEAMNEVGDVFINLGKVGREYVINEVLKQEGTSQVDLVRKYADELEERVSALLDCTDHDEMIAVLDHLPLSQYSAFDPFKKKRIADLLIREKGWKGLFSLDRKIVQLNKAIDREERENYERENIINLPDGKAAATINLRFNAAE